MRRGGETKNRAPNYDCEALGQFTSVLSRTVSCQTGALPSGIDKRRGWNKFTLLSFLLSLRSLPVAQRIFCSPGWLRGGLDQGGGRQRGGRSCLRLRWWFIHLSFTDDNVGEIRAKMLLICLLLTATVPMQDKQTCFSII